MPRKWTGEQVRMYLQPFLVTKRKKKKKKKKKKKRKVKEKKNKNKRDKEGYAQYFQLLY